MNISRTTRMDTSFKQTQSSNEVDISVVKKHVFKFHGKVCKSKVKKRKLMLL